MKWGWSKKKEGSMETENLSKETKALDRIRAKENNYYITMDKSNLYGRITATEALAAAENIRPRRGIEFRTADQIAYLDGTEAPEPIYYSNVLEPQNFPDIQQIEWNQMQDATQHVQEHQRLLERQARMQQSMYNAQAVAPSYQLLQNPTGTQLYNSNTGEIFDIDSNGTLTRRHG